LDSHLAAIFRDEKLKERIRRKLPYLFHIAELDSSRAGKVGMQVGSLRESIIVSLLVYRFGESNVQSEIPITEREIDVLVFDNPISIKTITGKGGVKVIWTVDPIKAREFLDRYEPRFDTLLTLINWNSVGGFYYVPVEVQNRAFEMLGREKYLKLPKPGTNPRGVEISRNGLDTILEDKDTLCLEIGWERPNIKYSPYKRWLDYWHED
jgi:hypothetical protein